MHPKRVPQMADAEAVIQGLPKRDDVRYIGLVLNHKGFERARDAGLGEIGMAVVASDTYNQRNQGVPTRESVKAWLDIAREARAAGMRANVMISSAFGCPFEGEVPLSRVLDLVDQVLEGEPVELGIADSIGVGVPSQVTEMIRAIRAARARQCRFAVIFTTRETRGSPMRRRRSMRAWPRSMPASAASAAARLRRPRRATSRPTTCCTCWTAPA